MAEFTLMHPLGAQSFRRSSGYGYRVHPVTGSDHLHNGVDYAASEGTDVYAASPGVVSKVASDSSSGNYVEIDHGDGRSTLYLHLLNYATQLGAQVAEGDLIGAVGSTGRSTGAHLHFMLKLNGETTDPEPYITRTWASYAVNYWWVAIITLGTLLGALMYRRKFGQVELP